MIISWCSKKISSLWASWFWRWRAIRCLRSRERTCPLQWTSSPRTIRRTFVTLLCSYSLLLKTLRKLDNDWRVEILQIFFFPFLTGICFRRRRDRASRRSKKLCRWSAPASSANLNRLRCTPMLWRTSWRGSLTMAACSACSSNLAPSSTAPSNWFTDDSDAIFVLTRSFQLPYSCLEVCWSIDLCLIVIQVEYGCCMVGDWWSLLAKTVPGLRAASCNRWWSSLDRSGTCRRLP